MGRQFGRRRPRASGPSTRFSRECWPRSISEFRGDAAGSTAFGAVCMARLFTALFSVRPQETCSRSDAVKATRAPRSAPSFAHLAQVTHCAIMRCRCNNFNRAIATTIAVCGGVFETLETISGSYRVISAVRGRPVRGGGIVSAVCAIVSRRSAISFTPRAIASPARGRLSPRCSVV